MLDSVLKLAKTFCLGALTAFLLVAIPAMVAIQESSQRLEWTISQDADNIALTALGARHDLDARLGETNRILARETEHAERDLNTRLMEFNSGNLAVAAAYHETLTQALQAYNQRLADFNTISAVAVNNSTKALADFNGTLSLAQKDLTRVSLPASLILDNLNDSAPLFFNCDHNADCLYNRYVGSARAGEKTATHLESLSDSMARVATRFAGPSTVKGKIWDGFKIALYGWARFL